MSESDMILAVKNAARSKIIKELQNELINVGIN